MKNLTEYIINNRINEMADSLSNFKNKLSYIIPQLIENWCLVRWCDLNPNNNISKRLRNHWCSELKSYIKDIALIKVKSGRKDKAIKNVLIDSLELNDYNVIYDIIKKKFTKEGLFKYIYIISVDCSTNIIDICNILNSKNIEDIDNYFS